MPPFSQLPKSSQPLEAGLHKDGRRLTPQRLRVLHLFEELGSGRHLSAEDVHYQEQFTHEEDLLKAFLDLWEQESPDIVTGWNVRFFDIPYLVNRTTNVLGK